MTEQPFIKVKIFRFRPKIENFSKFLQKSVKMLNLASETISKFKIGPIFTEISEICFSPILCKKNRRTYSKDFKVFAEIWKFVPLPKIFWYKKRYQEFLNQKNLFFNKWFSERFNFTFWVVNKKSEREKKFLMSHRWFYTHLPLTNIMRLF